ncbi:MAG: cytochrome c oxidase subunit II [Actinomycetota bacterium]|jgi:cytochrome c oxidase subunit 2|nr:cytochrome c oxidase subunit II [Actinomycetota bacterium]
MPTRRRLLARCSALALVLVAGGCSSGFDFGAPDPTTTQGEEVLDLWRGAHWAAAAVGALIWALVLFCILRYRRRNDELPSQSPENIPVEVFYTLTPLVVVAVLFVFTVLTQQRVVALSDDPDVVVDVVGFQWSWQFEYPEEGVTVVSNGFDTPRMVLPVGATVRLRLESPDVNHSFWVPRFLVKRDLIPGIDNEIEVEVTQAGEWEGRCAEFCGLDHYRMNFSVAAVPPEEYRAWLDERRADPVTTQAASASTGGAGG